MGAKAMNYVRSTDDAEMVEIYPGWFVSMEHVKRFGLIIRQNTKEEAEWEDRGPPVPTPWGRSVAPWRTIHPQSGIRIPCNDVARNDLLIAGALEPKYLGLVKAR